MLILALIALSACNTKNDKTAEQSMNVPEKQEINTSDQMQNEVSTKEKELQEYELNQFCFSCTYHIGNLMGTVNLENYSPDFPPESIWFSANKKEADDSEESSKQYVAVDLDGQFIGALDGDKYAIISPFFDGVACILDLEESRRMLINTEIQDVTGQYVDVEGEEEVIILGSDETGITLWTRQDIDTYDSHSTELRAKDLSGQIKNVWSTNEEATKDIDKLSYVYYLSGANCSYSYLDTTVILNLTTGNAMTFEDFNTMFDDGSFLTADKAGNGLKYTWHDSTNESSIEFPLIGYCGEFNDGFMFFRGENEEAPFLGFVDEKGTPVITLDANLEITNTPVYREGFALVEIKNDGGERFVTLIDMDGKFAFEPIKGEVWAMSGTSPYRGKLENHEYYIKQQDDFYYLNSDGTTEKIPYNFENAQEILGKTYVLFNGSLQIIE